MRGEGEHVGRGYRSLICTHTVTLHTVEMGVACTAVLYIDTHSQWIKDTGLPVIQLRGHVVASGHTTCR